MKLLRKGPAQPVRRAHAGGRRAVGSTAEEPYLSTDPPAEAGTGSGAPEAADPTETVDGAGATGALDGAAGAGGPGAVSSPESSDETGDDAGPDLTFGPD